MANLPTGKVLVLGFLANVLGLLSFFLMLYLSLALFSLVYTTVDATTRAEASGTLPTERSMLALLADSAVASARNALKGLWDARLGFLILGAVGAVAAWADQFGSRVFRKRSWLSSLLCVGVILTLSVVTFVVAMREDLARWITVEPEVYRWRDFIMGSPVLHVIVGLIVALTLTYPIWAVWRWWYARLIGWSTPATAVAATAAPALAVSSEHATRQWRKLFTLLAALLVLCGAGLLLVGRYRDQMAIRVQHDTAFVDVAREPHQSSALTVGPDVNRLRVVNINGLGSVDLHLSPTTDYADAIQSVTGWSFEWRSDTTAHYYVDVPVDDLEPGEYYLHFVQQEGWGFYEYALSHGGGQLGYASALAFGFLVACSIILGLALILLVAAWYLQWPLWEGQDGGEAGSRAGE